MFTNAITTCYTFVIPYCARQAPASDTTLSVLRLAAAALARRHNFGHNLLVGLGGSGSFTYY